MAINGAPAMFGGADQSVVAGSARWCVQATGGPGDEHGRDGNVVGPSSVVPAEKAVPAH